MLKDNIYLNLNHYVYLPHWTRREVVSGVWLVYEVQEVRKKLLSVTFRQEKHFALRLGEDLFFSLNVPEKTNEIRCQ